MSSIQSKRQIARANKTKRKLSLELREILELGGLAHLLDQPQAQVEKNTSNHDTQSVFVMEAQLASVDSGHNSFSRSHNEFSHSIFTASTRDTYRNHSFTVQKHGLQINPVLLDFAGLHEDRLRKLHSDLLITIQMRAKRHKIEQQSTNEIVLHRFLATSAENDEQRLSFFEKRRNVIDKMVINNS